jgi:hypothetical protein
VTAPSPLSPPGKPRAELEAALVGLRRESDLLALRIWSAEEQLGIEHGAGVVVEQREVSAPAGGVDA